MTQPPTLTHATQPYRPSDDAAADVPGYEILGVLGRGGMGVVYKARHVALDRVVALKMVLPDGADDQSRFRAEAEAVARLQHPHIVGIHEIGEHQGRSYLALEYVEGGTLADRLRREPLPAVEAVRLVETLARAMHAAHVRNVVHRDLKPGNVLLTADGAPKIADFGLARRLDRDVNQTRTGAIVGTPAYMAPEQAAGDGQAVGPAADVYALGVLLYECLTGRPPFVAAGMLQTLELVRTQQPVPPRRLQPGTPRDAETICLKCLHKEPARRYDSALALADDCAALLRGEPVKARPVGTAERAWSWAKRRPAAALAIVLAGLALLSGGGGGGALALWRSAEQDRARERGLRDEAEDARQKEALARGRLDQVLALQKIQLAYRDWLDDDVANARHRLDDGKEAPRDWEYHFVRRLTRPVLDVAVFDSTPQGLAWSPDGARLVAGTQWQGLQLIAAADGRSLGRLAGTEPPDGPVRMTLANPVCAAFSPPDGRVISSHRLTGVTVWDPTTNTRTTLLRDAGWTACLAVSPDGKRVALGAGAGIHHDSRVRLFDVAAAQELPSLDGQRGPVTALAFSSDGRLVSGGGQTVRVWDVAARRASFTFTDLPGLVKGIDFTADGQRLAVGCDDGSLVVFDVVKGQKVFSVNSQTGPVTCVAFRRDGGRIATGGEQGTVTVWDAATGHIAFRLRGHLQPTPGVVGVAFHPDGRWLASAGSDRTIKIWDAQGPQDVRRFTLANVDSQFQALSPNGQLALTRDLPGGTFRLWDVTTRRPRGVVRAGESNRVLTGAPTDDGRLVLLTTDGGWEVWDAAADRRLSARPGSTPLDWVGALAVSPDGSYLAVDLSGRNNLGDVVLWDVAAGEEKARLPTTNLTQAVAFSGDGRRLAVLGVDGTLVVVEPATGREVLRRQEPGGGIQAVAFLPGGRRVVASSQGGRLSVWDLETGLEQEPMQGNAQAFSLAFSPDGRRLAALDGGGVVTLWDPSCVHPALTLRAGIGVVHIQTRLAFSADGHRLWVLSARGDVFEWDGSPGP